MFSLIASKLALVPPGDARFVAGGRTTVVLRSGGVDLVAADDEVAFEFIGSIVYVLLFFCGSERNTSSHSHKSWSKLTG